MGIRRPLPGALLDKHGNRKNVLRAELGIELRTEELEVRPGQGLTADIVGFEQNHFVGRKHITLAA